MQDENAIIIILINGEPFETVLSMHGFQVFKPNSGISWLASRAKFSVSELVQAHRENKISRDDLKALLRGIGYSVWGYCEEFPEDEIENPLWD